MYKTRLRLLLIVFIFTLKSVAQTPTLGEKSGDALALALPFTALASTVVFKNGDKGTLQFVEAITTTYVLTHGIKRFVNKTRPNGADFSFPSGHTSVSFTGAAFLQKRYGWKVGLPSYAVASYVGYTRIRANKHDFTDVAAGAILGIGSAYLFTKPFKKENVSLSVSNAGNAYLVQATVRLK